jgi:hypothetical protein
VTIEFKLNVGDRWKNFLSVFLLLPIVITVHGMDNKAVQTVLAIFSTTASRSHALCNTAVNTTAYSVVSLPTLILTATTKFFSGTYGPGKLRTTRTSIFGHIIFFNTSTYAYVHTFVVETFAGVAGLQIQQRSMPAEAEPEFVFTAQYARS